MSRSLPLIIGGVIFSPGAVPISCPGKRSACLCLRCYSQHFSAKKIVREGSLSGITIVIALSQKTSRTCTAAFAVPDREEKPPVGMAWLLRFATPPHGPRLLERTEGVPAWNSRAASAAAFCCCSRGQPAIPACDAAAIAAN